MQPRPRAGQEKATELFELLQGLMLLTLFALALVRTNWKVSKLQKNLLRSLHLKVTIPGISYHPHYPHLTQLGDRARLGLSRKTLDNPLTQRIVTISFLLLLFNNAR